MLRAGCVAGVGAPDVLGEEEGEQAEEESGDFEPEDAANPAEGAEEASQAPAGCAGYLAGRFGFLLAAFCWAGLRWFDYAGWLRAGAAGGGLSTRLGWGLGLNLGICVGFFGGALLSVFVCQPSRNADSDTQSSTQLIGIHTGIQFNSG